MGCFQLWPQPGELPSRCPQGGPQSGWTEDGLARSGQRKQRAWAEGPPSQALWRLVSWEAELPPSSEQVKDSGKPGAMPHVPSPPRTFQDPSALHSLGPNSRNQALLSSALEKAQSSRLVGVGPALPLGLEWGGSQEGVRQARRVYEALGGFWQCPPTTLNSRRDQCPVFLQHGHRDAGEAVCPHGIGSDTGQDGGGRGWCSAMG